MFALSQLVVEDFFSGDVLASLAHAQRGFYGSVLNFAGVLSAPLDDQGRGLCPRPAASRVARGAPAASNAAEGNEGGALLAPIAFSIRYSVAAEIYALPSCRGRSWALARLHASRPPAAGLAQNAGEFNRRRDADWKADDEPKTRKIDERLLVFDLAAKRPRECAEFRECWGTDIYPEIDFLGYVLFPSKARRLVEYYGASKFGPESEELHGLLVGLVAAGLPEAARELVSLQGGGSPGVEGRGLDGWPPAAARYLPHILVGALLGRDEKLAATTMQLMQDKGRLLHFIADREDCDPRSEFYTRTARAMLLRVRASRAADGGDPGTGEAHAAEWVDCSSDRGGGLLLPRPGPNFPRLYARLICGQTGPCHVLRELGDRGAGVSSVLHVLALPYPILDPGEARALAVLAERETLALSQFCARGLFAGSPAPVLAELRRLVAARGVSLCGEHGSGAETLVEIVGEARDGPACREAMALYRAHCLAWNFPAEDRFRDARARVAEKYRFISPRFRTWLACSLFRRSSAVSAPRENSAAEPGGEVSEPFAQQKRASRAASHEKRWGKPLDGVALLERAQELHRGVPAFAKHSLPDPGGVLDAFSEELGHEDAAALCGLSLDEFESLLP